MQRTRIVIVDDSVTIRAMIESLLEKDERLRVVGIARNAEEALDMIAATDPDVVTLDIAMPGTDGMAILDRIMNSKPRPVIMLSSLVGDGAEITVTAIEHGAAACFDKSHIVREAGKLISLIKQVGYRKPIADRLAFAA